MSRYLFLASLLFHFLYPHNCLQAQFQQLGEKDYQNIIEGLDYSKTKKKLRVKEFDFEPQKQEQRKQPELGLFRGFFELFRVFAIFCVISLICYILYQIIKLIETSDKLIEISEHVEIEEIEEIDTIDLLQKALNEGDYRMAIRMKFLRVLQEFNSTELIKWKEDKTNRDYLNELKSSAHYKFFKEASSIYALVWYGNHHIDKDDYELLSPKLELVKI